MTGHTLFLSYRVALVKWKHRLTADKYPERAFTKLIINMCSDSSGTLRIEIMRYSTQQHGYLNTSSSLGSSTIMQREEAYSLLSAPDMGQLWKAFWTNEANVVSCRETEQQLLSQPQNWLYLNEQRLEGNWVHGQQDLLKPVTPLKGYWQRLTAFYNGNKYSWQQENN